MLGRMPVLISVSDLLPARYSSSFVGIIKLEFADISSRCNTLVQ